jgi:hypothetical protein
MDRYKCQAVVDKIILEKKNRGGDWVKPHPECPEVVEATLYLCWSGAGKRREEGQGTTTSTKGSTEHDMADANTKLAIDKLLSRPTGPASSVPVIVDAPPGQPTPTPKPIKPVVTPKTKTKMELHQASLTKSANTITSKLRTLQAILADIDHMPKATDAQKSDVDLYKAKHRLLHTGFIATQVQVEAILARKDRSSELELDEVATKTAAVFNL